MLWICDENSAGNTGMFYLFLSSAYTASRSFMVLMLPHQQVSWGCTRSWEGTQLGQMTPCDQENIPYEHMTSWSVITQRVKFTMDVIIQGLSTDWPVAEDFFLLHHLSSFVLFALFFKLTKLSWSQAMSIPHFYLPILSSTSVRGGSKQLHGA